jgi:hypothetical protein
LFSEHVYHTKYTTFPNPNLIISIQIAAVLGFARAISPNFYAAAKIRVNAVLPGTVRTGLLTSKEWEMFPEQYFTPVEKIVEAVLIFVDGTDPKHKDEQGIIKGQAIECSGSNMYNRKQYEYCDEGMRAVMQATNVETMEH